MALNLLSLLLLLLGINLLYKEFFFERDLQKHSSIINLVREVPPDTRVIYLGESSNNTARGDDRDTRKISDFIADYYPGLGVQDLTKPAAHAGVFKVLLRHMPEDSQVETVIVTLTLRSFNAQWIHSPLETSLQKSLVLLRPYPPLVNRFLLSFKAYEIKDEKERTRDFQEQWERDLFHFPYEFPHAHVADWDRWMSRTGIRDDSGRVDRQQTILACHYIKAYGFQIDTLTNPRIADFDDIVELARERGWTLVFNLMAENMERAEELVGEDLVFLMNANRNLLKEYYGSRGVLVIDNLDAVEDDQYIDRDWTTEHYAERGRKLIARKVAEELKRWYGDQYQDAGY